MRTFFCFLFFFAFLVLQVESLCVDNSTYCLQISEMTIQEQISDLSNQKFFFRKNGIFSVDQGNVYHYSQNGSVLTITENIQDSFFQKNSNLYGLANNIIVGSPDNTTNWLVKMYTLNNGVWSNTFSFNNITGTDPNVNDSNEDQNIIDNCFNIGKSVLLFSNSTEIAIGGDSCLLFYKYRINSWVRFQVLDIEGKNLEIGNYDNVISGNGMFPGAPDFGDYLQNFLFCRNNFDATWGVCYNLYNSYSGFIQSYFHLCNSEYGTYLTVNDWGYYDLTFFTFNPSNSVFTILSYANGTSNIIKHVVDYNVVVSQDCTFAYNYYDVDANETSIIVAAYDASEGAYTTVQSTKFDLATSSVPYIIFQNKLVANLNPITNQRLTCTPFNPDCTPNPANNNVNMIGSDNVNFNIDSKQKITSGSLSSSETENEYLTSSYANIPVTTQFHKDTNINIEMFVSTTGQKAINIQISSDLNNNIPVTGTQISLSSSTSKEISQVSNILATSNTNNPVYTTDVISTKPITTTKILSSNSPIPPIQLTGVLTTSDLYSRTSMGRIITTKGVNLSGLIR